MIRKTILFSFDDTKISKTSKETLEKVASVMKDDRDIKVSVSGHTDSTGASSYNYTLGLRRAQVVADYLESLGIENQRLKVSSYGKIRPIESNRIREGRQKNRRVEIESIPASGH